MKDRQGPAGPWPTREGSSSVNKRQQSVSRGSGEEQLVPFLSVTEINPL